MENHWYAKKKNSVAIMLMEDVHRAELHSNITPKNKHAKLTDVSSTSLEGAQPVLEDTILDITHANYHSA